MRWEEGQGQGEAEAEMNQVAVVENVKPMDHRPQMRPALIQVWGEDGLPRLEEAWGEYFKECAAKNEVPTVAGLAVVAKVHWDTFRNYRWRKESTLPPEWMGALKTAWDRVVSQVERLLVNRPSGQVGPIFWLKNNAGYRDVTEHEAGEGLVRAAEGMRAFVAGVLGASALLRQPKVIEAEVVEVRHEEDGK